MSHEEHESQSAPIRATLTGAKSPVWAKLLLVAAAVLMVAGLALPLVSGRSSPKHASSTPGAAGMVDSPTGTATGTDPVGGPAADSGPSWGPAVFRMGFSFFVGFAVAYAIRSFIKAALVALGFFLIALFGLQYSGLVEVKWGFVHERYDEIAEGLSTGARSAWGAAVSYLPSAASATAGLLAGFWRRGA